MAVLEKIKEHFQNKQYTRIERLTSETSTEISNGYIVAYSKDFIVLQETDDFQALGYNILPVNQIKSLRFNKNDRYYHQIMIWEKEIDKVGINYNIDLSNWQSVFKSLKEREFNVIVECENPEINTFTIGPITTIDQDYVLIKYFDATGFWDEDPVEIGFNDITKVIFDDRYINIISKYLRHRKSNKQTS